MSALVIEVEGRVLRLEGQPVYRIGRAIEADVVLTAGSVSRQHAELHATEYGWVLVDRGSQFGTYVDDERVTEYPIERRIAVRCGPPAPGSTLAIIPAEEYDVAAATPVAPAPPPATPAEPAAPAYVVNEATRPPYPVAPPPASPPPATPPMGVPMPSAPSWAPPPPGSRPAAAPGLPPAISGNDATQILAMPRPSGPPGAAPAPRSGPDLLLIAEGREHRFRHPTPITVGRRSDCTVVIGDPACSRVHGRIDPVPGGWTYTNLSNEGTFHDGRRVATTRFDERLGLRLGHPVAGPELTLVPILSAAEEERRIARRRLRKRLAVIGGVAAALLLVVGVVGVAFLAGRDEPSRPRGGGGTDVLEAAKAATVKITAESHLIDDPSNTGTYHGSGSIIRSDGLILTNAHVAAPESPGLAQKYGDEVRIADPDYLLISLTDGMTDTNAPAAYRARVVEADGNLDVAVVQIYADENGGPIDGNLDLPTVPIGSSGDLRAGDNVTVLGFPAVAGDGESITVTTGVISTVLNDPDLGPRSELDTDARIAPGNSGGMAINEDGQLIGIPTSLFAAEGSTVTSGRIRSIDVVKDLIEKAEDETD
ncbi:FHA domain-containing protein [Nocardioides nitrophenolicus]|uniref:FHA domain-containing protein n=1 Tax=Nocardioides nitrophenolicus TaxID=60489 RepID=UPI00195965B3|nr:FHA domain-containing protein [Nocardioides nitrophenolicus]MBM7515752.1 putative serine protease PepD [Nocardioides nitrophenolicus]